MLAFDEKVTITDRDGSVIGSCRMVGWVEHKEAGFRRWHGEFVPIAGQPWEFAVTAIERSGLQVVCEDGATARILAPVVTDALSSGVRCTFEGVWPPPRPVTLAGL